MLGPRIVDVGDTNLYQLDERYVGSTQHTSRQRIRYKSQVDARLLGVSCRWHCRLACTRLAVVVT